MAECAKRISRHKTAARRSKAKLNVIDTEKRASEIDMAKKNGPEIAF